MDSSSATPPQPTPPQGKATSQSSPTSTTQTQTEASDSGTAAAASNPAPSTIDERDDNTQSTPATTGDDHDHDDKGSNDDDNETTNEDTPSKDDQNDNGAENADSDEGAEADEVALRIKWGRTMYAVELPPRSTVADLKRRIFELTEVQPKRQKVIGLPSVGTSRLPDDALRLGTLGLAPDQRILLVGSREADISLVNSGAFAAAGSADVVNDLDVDYAHDGSRRTLKDAATYRRRLERRIETTDITIINEPRLRKKLLVLDLDYTLFDCKSAAPSIAALGRPGLHQMLASAYRFYDIVVWSQTHWRWLEAKLTELSMLFASDYKLSFVLDQSSMFAVTSRKNGHERTHEVKALEIIWRKFPGRWSAHNSIHIDDLSKNFALNPQSGLKISQFKNANVTRDSDRELFLLERYLTLIAQNEPDFTKLKHKHWKRYCAHNAPQGGAEAGPSSNTNNQ